MPRAEPPADSNPTSAPVVPQGSFSVGSNPHRIPPRRPTPRSPHSQTPINPFTPTRLLSNGLPRGQNGQLVPGAYPQDATEVTAKSGDLTEAKPSTIDLAHGHKGSISVTPENAGSSTPNPAFTTPAVHSKSSTNTHSDDGSVFKRPESPPPTRPVSQSSDSNSGESASREDTKSDSSGMANTSGLATPESISQNGGENSHLKPSESSDALEYPDQPKAEPILQSSIVRSAEAIIDGNSQTPLGKDESPAALDPPPPWDFTLPRLTPTSLAPKSNELFSLRDLVAGIQNNIGFAKVQDYTSRHDSKSFSKIINKEIYGFPSIFYAVETNDDLIIRHWISHGADIRAVHKESGTPLLAFAVFNSDNIHRHTTLAVATLLSLGAPYKVFPKAFYSPYNQDLPEDGPDEKDLTDLKSPKRKWCAPPHVRQKLASTLNLTQRYYLERATRIKKPSIRQKQVASRRGAENMLGIEYFLIGQASAAASLKTKLLSYMTLPSKRPLVLVFAG